MKVTIEFLGTQRTAAGADRVEMPITRKTTVNDALDYVQRKYPELKLAEWMVIVVVNQHIASLDQVLNADDVISFLPFLSGG
jgi:molybdopterin converting factor small subunit